MTPATRDILDHAKKLGLTDVTIVHQKKHNCLIAHNPNGKLIKMGIARSRHATSNFRARVTALTQLSRLARS